MADSLPSIDFGFNDLRERMAQFTVRFDEFIERGRKRVLEERNAFRMNVAELEGEDHDDTDVTELLMRCVFRRPADAEDCDIRARIEVNNARANPRKGSGRDRGDAGGYRWLDGSEG
jgi:hypothetical protein